MREIRLMNSDLVGIIDDADYERVSQFNWYASFAANRGVYIKTACRAASSMKRKGVYLHRFVMDAQSGQEVDHRNNNGLDCRRANLRFATRAQNNQNRGKHRLNTSGFKGVSWDAARGKWRARIRANQQHIDGGAYDTAVEAAKAHDRIAKQYCGEFARLNFPERCDALLVT